MVRNLAETNVDAAAELALLDDELRLALLEITELSAELYAIHSGVVRTELVIAAS
jgi:hypothetical protein